MKDLRHLILHAFAPLIGMPSAVEITGNHYVGPRQKPSTPTRERRNKRNKTARLARRRNRR